MKPFVGVMLASIVAGFVLVRIVEILVGTVGVVAVAAKTAAFSGAWTAVTSATGMRAFTERVRRARAGVKRVSKRIDRHISRM